MVEVVGRCSVITEALVRSHVNPCKIHFGRSGTGTAFSPGASLSSVNAAYSFIRLLQVL